jgi:hypothetical protein
MFLSVYKILVLFLDSPAPSPMANLILVLLLVYLTSFPLANFILSLLLFFGIQLHAPVPLKAGMSCLHLRTRLVIFQRLSIHVFCLMHT